MGCGTSSIKNKKQAQKTVLVFLLKQGSCKHNSSQH